MNAAVTGSDLDNSIGSKSANEAEEIIAAVMKKQILISKMSAKIKMTCLAINPNFSAKRFNKIPPDRFFPVLCNRCFRNCFGTQTKLSAPSVYAWVPHPPAEMFRIRTKKAFYTPF